MSVLLKNFWLGNCLGFRDGSVVKNPPARARDADVIPGPGRFTWRKKWQCTPLFLPGKPHGQRSLACCSPWSHKESDAT